MEVSSIPLAAVHVGLQVIRNVRVALSNINNVAAGIANRALARALSSAIIPMIQITVAQGARVSAALVAMEPLIPESSATTERAMKMV